MGIELDDMREIQRANAEIMELYGTLPEDSEANLVLVSVAPLICNGFELDNSQRE